METKRRAFSDRRCLRSMRTSACNPYRAAIRWPHRGNGHLSQNRLFMCEEQKALQEVRAALGPEFEIKRRLGQGETATVYQVWEHALSRLVAIKVMHAQRAENEPSS